MVRPRRALDAPPPTTLARRIVVILTVPVLIIGAVAAGVALAAQQNQLGAGASPNGAPANSSDDESPTVDPSREAELAKAASTCRREVARAESVLNAAGPGVSHWRETVQAQTDLKLDRHEEKDAEKIWKRTRAAGPSDVAKYQTAKGGYQPDTACAAVKGAPEAVAEQLKVCRARLGKVTSALGAADRAIKDWENHLTDMQRTEDEDDAEELWQQAWAKAPGNLDKYAAAMDALAKTKSCPR